MLSEKLIDHFQYPRNVGELGAPAQTVTATNVACGDELQLSVLFDGPQITAVRFRVRGCTASIAAGSALTELLLQYPLADMSIARIEDAVGGLPALSKHAAVLCLDAVRLIRLPPTR